VATIGNPAEVAEERRRLGGFTAPEKKALALGAAMLGLWVTSSWLRQIDTTMVAVAGAVAMFLPGMRLLTWARAQQTTAWDALLLIGGVTSLGGAAASTGLATYLVSALPAMDAWPVAGVVAVISVVTLLIHLPVPIGPAIVALLVPPILALAASTGQSPALYGLTVIFSASAAFLLPIDAVTVITYSKGYFRMADMLRPGIVISIVWVVTITALMTWIAPVLGLA
jgi:sodium-dependent dicarboxylate transporter 2/3/5